MTSDDDLLDALRRANPVPAERGDAARSRRAAALRDKIVKSPHGFHFSSRGRGRLVAVVAVVSVSAGATAYALVTREPSKRLTVACHEAADLRSKTIVVGSGGEDPVATCAALWDNGAFGPRPAPLLVVCVLESGVVGVFPQGEQTCSRLQLPEPPVGPTTPATTITAVGLKEALVARFLAVSCVPPAEAEAIVRRELDGRGLTGWRIETGGGAGTEGFSAGRPCVGLAFDEEGKRVILVPGPPRS